MGLPQLQHPYLPALFFNFHRLWCTIYCPRLFCRFALVPHLHDLFPLIYVHGRTGFHYLILAPFPCISSGVDEHSLFHASLRIVLLPVLGMLIHCDPLFLWAIGTVCNGRLFLFVFFCCMLFKILGPNLVLHLTVSALRSPFDKNRNVSSSLITCLPITLIQWPYLNHHHPLFMF
jgi:hypothetical protein